MEQPIGVGFTKGQPDVSDEEGVAREFAGFLDQVYEVFTELKPKRLWITGESYAGMYIPYIASHLYKAGNKHDLQGVFIIDGVVTSEVCCRGALVVLSLFFSFLFFFCRWF